jgi:hypothetical protein
MAGCSIRDPHLTNRTVASQKRTTKENAPVTRQQVVDLSEALQKVAAILEAAQNEIALKQGGSARQGDPMTRIHALVRQTKEAHDEAIKLCLPLLSDDDFSALAAPFRRLLTPPRTT